MRLVQGGKWKDDTGRGMKVSEFCTQDKHFMSG